MGSLLVSNRPLFVYIVQMCLKQRIRYKKIVSIVEQFRLVKMKARLGWNIQRLLLSLFFLCECECDSPPTFFPFPFPPVTNHLCLRWRQQRQRQHLRGRTSQAKRKEGGGGGGEIKPHCWQFISRPHNTVSSYEAHECY